MYYIKYILFLNIKKNTCIGVIKMFRLMTFSNSVDKLLCM